MAKGIFSVKKLLLNALVVLLGICLVLLLSIRHAYWGPEGPVGGLLLLVPYLFLAAAVTAALIVFGTFSWIPGRPRIVRFHRVWTSDPIRSVGILFHGRG